MNDLLADCISVRIEKKLNSSSEDLFFLYSACRTRSAHIFHSPTNQQPVGYMVCAQINRYTLDAWELNGFAPKTESEWRDGYLTVILDVVFANGFSKFCQTEMFHLLKSKKLFLYTRRNKMMIYKFTKSKFCLLGRRILNNGGIKSD